LGDEQNGLVICRYAKHYEVEALDGEHAGHNIKCVTRSNSRSVVAGDRVIWRPDLKTPKTGVVESVNERASLLERPDNFGKLKPVAANIDQMLIVVAVEPQLQPNLIDRYLVAAAISHIQPVIVLNKLDLIDDRNRKEVESQLNTYRELGYLVLSVVCSRHLKPELAELPEIIADKTSIVVGQSGVGKSSLINTILPQANLKTNELSSHTREGTHTTTMARLFHLPQSGSLIDSPGIRDFSLWHIDVDQVQQGFVEIKEAAQNCKFRNCKHEKEPHCAVKKAVELGDISAKRFDSFERIKIAIQEQQAKGFS
jgi:ribosome biogenesis GTPase